MRTDFITFIIVGIIIGTVTLHVVFIGLPTRACKHKSQGRSYMLIAGECWVQHPSMDILVPARSLEHDTN